MKITSEEIERLLRVVSESLRLQWEKAMIQGRSLLQVKKERENALAQIEDYNKKGKRLMKIAASFAVLFVVTFAYPSGNISIVWVVCARSFIFVIFMACICWIWHLAKKKTDADRTVAECDEVLDRLEKSVDLLNCLGTGNPNWDIIDEAQVTNKLVHAAYKVLSAKADFEACRINGALQRVKQAIDWIEHCEALFDRIWDTATTEFALVLDKGAIFKRASRELAKDQAERTSVKDMWY